MSTHTFFCVDGHTCGNPVRLVAGGGPTLRGSTMVEKRAHFLAAFDWVRTGLMFEPRGHDMMSGAILYPPTRPDADIAFLFIETSGCLPMCGHGTIGTVTMGLERGLITPREDGVVRIDTPAGLVTATYVRSGPYVDSVRITNVASYLHASGLTAHVDGLGEITADVAYGGNFYAIIDAQAAFSDIADVSPSDLLRWSPKVREAFRARYRSPCGTGTSARMAQWAAQGKLKVGDDFIHESIIGTLFRGRVEATAKVGSHDAIIPSIEGWARMTGLNTIFIDDRDPLRAGFQLKD